MGLQSFMLDPEALAKRPELFKLIVQEVRAEQLRRGDISAVDEKNVAVAIHYLLKEQPARKSENVCVLPQQPEKTSAAGDAGEPSTKPISLEEAKACCRKILESQESRHAPDPD